MRAALESVATQLNELRVTLEFISCVTGGGALPQIPEPFVIPNGYSTERLYTSIQTLSAELLGSARAIWTHVNAPGRSMPATVSS